MDSRVICWVSTVICPVRVRINPPLTPTKSPRAYGMGSPAPGLNKIFNEEHDVIGHPQFGGISDVQQLLQSVAAGSTPFADMESILAFIQSL